MQIETTCVELEVKLAYIAHFQHPNFMEGIDETDNLLYVAFPLF